MQQPPADPLVGRTVAHYEVIAPLGGGGMGLVYAARDTRLGRRVALKFLPPQWSHDESAKERFMREAQAASATDHPNICTIHDIGTTDDGRLFIVMAHYDGDTLKTRLEAGPLGVDEAIDLAAQIAEGLAKAHAEGVVHRDIKPGNLMLTETGVKILDFGLAKMADSRFTLTLEGSTVGTIAYMSPEQARGDEADARSDVWGLGAVLYEMLAGRVPFRGGYPEAIAHAIRDVAPDPLRAARPEVPEALEQLVFRALHKDPAVRFQTARDLARALRRLQGRTLPLDLRTEPLPPVDAAYTRVRTRPWWTRRTVAAATAVAALLAGAPTWIFWPVEPVRVAVAPVVNQTGYAELDPYRMALTQELTSRLADSRAARVLPYERLAQIVRRFREAGGDVSSRDAMQALTDHAGARVIVAPTLLHDSGGWTARLEFRDPATATTVATAETGAVVSSLPKDAAYGLVPELAALVTEYLRGAGPRRAALADATRRLAGIGPPAATQRFRTLDAAAAFERGIDAFDQQELRTAVDAFAEASTQDPRNPLVLAWRSRTALLMRRDAEAADAADAAMRLITGAPSPGDRLLTEAVAAEARRDSALAERSYRRIVDQTGRAPEALLQLAAFLDRQGRAADAIAAYHQALSADARLVRPHVDLCRLYNPRELPRAREHGARALEMYRALGEGGGEAQARFCLVDVLRLGAAAERNEARGHADAALALLEARGYRYGVARAHNYVALAAYAQGRLLEATSAWERALAGARAVGNVVLEPLVLMNLGAAHSRLGDRPRQLQYYEQSARLFEGLGQQQRAAEIEANLGALLIEYAGRPDEGLRRLQNALVVSRKLGNTNFELFAARLTGAYHRAAGRHEDAERELNRALALARERGLGDYVQSVTLELARLRYDGGREAAVVELLATLPPDGSSAATSALMLMAQARARLGEFTAAREAIEEATRALARGGDPELQPLLHAAAGAVAYESGRPAEALAGFGRAAALWKDDLPEAASVEARAYVGLLDALAGHIDAGRRHLTSSLDRARRMGQLSIEARCRVFLARVEVAARRFEEALAVLDTFPFDDPSRAVNPELKAQALYWRSRARAARGDRGASADADRARRILADRQAALPASVRAAVARRPDIHLMLQ